MARGGRLVFEYYGWKTGSNGDDPDKSQHQVLFDPAHHGSLRRAEQAIELVFVFTSDLPIGSADVILDSLVSQYVLPAVN